MGLISVVHSPQSVKVTGLRDNVRRVARSIEFYNDYVTRLDNIESKIRQEKQQFESEKHSFMVPQNLVGLIIGKQGANKKAIQDKYGIKIYVENSTKEEGESNEAIIHLSGKDITVLEKVQNEIELHEKIY
jgi:predicted PilT family ATPase